MAVNLSAIGRALESSGVSRDAIMNTLELAGFPEMREMVVQELYFDEDDPHYLSINVHGQKGTSPKHLRMVFNLLAKEISLNRGVVRVVSFKDFSDAVCGRGERHTPDSLMELDMLFVLDFYEDGAPFPLGAFDAMLVRAFVRRFMEEGLGFCTHTDIPLLKTTKWWPQNFLSLIDEYSTQFLVK
jgi:hypothetical protein